MDNLESPWLEWMKSHQGEDEVTGTSPSPFIEECFGHTRYGPLHGSTPPSCAATLCAALEESGYQSTKNAAAASFTHFGEPCDLQPGAIVVFQWASGDHHVTVCQEIINDQVVRCLGGNQGHKLQPANFGRRWIIATRWPTTKLT